MVKCFKCGAWSARNAPRTFIGLGTAGDIGRGIPSSQWGLGMREMPCFLTLSRVKHFWVCSEEELQGTLTLKFVDTCTFWM